MDSTAAVGKIVSDDAGKGAAYGAAAGGIAARRKAKKGKAEAWEKGGSFGLSASWQAVTCVNTEAAPKDTMRRPTLVLSKYSAEPESLEF